LSEQDQFVLQRPSGGGLGVFLSSAQIGKIIESNLRKPSKIVPGDACE